MERWPAVVGVLRPALGRLGFDSACWRWYNGVTTEVGKGGRMETMAEEVRAPIKEAEVPWVVAYLREDIQDLRNEVREVRRLTIESYEKLDAKLDELRREMAVQLRWTTGIVIGAMLAMTGVFVWFVDRMMPP